MDLFNHGSSPSSDIPSHHAIPTWGNINTKTNTQTALDDVKVGVTWGLTSYYVNNHPLPLSRMIAPEHVSKIGVYVCAYSSFHGQQTPHN